MRTAKSKANVLASLGRSAKAYKDRLNAQIDSRAGFTSTFTDTSGPALSGVLGTETERKIASDALQKLTQGKPIPEASLALIPKYKLASLEHARTLQDTAVANYNVVQPAIQQPALPAPQPPAVDARDITTARTLNNSILQVKNTFWNRYQGIVRLLADNTLSPVSKEVNIGIRYINMLVDWHTMANDAMQLNRLKTQYYNIQDLHNMYIECNGYVVKDNDNINSLCNVIRTRSTLLNLYDLPTNLQAKYRLLDTHIDIIKVFTDKYNGIYNIDAYNRAQEVLDDLGSIDNAFRPTRGSGIIPDISYITHRVQLLKAEQHAGNHSTAITNELQDLLDYLLTNKHITKKEYLRLNK